MFHNYATRVRETSRNRRLLRFGDLIAAVYDACGKRRARGILRLAVNARIYGSTPKRLPRDLTVRIEVDMSIVTLIGLLLPVPTQPEIQG